MIVCHLDQELCAAYADGRVRRLEFHRFRRLPSDNSGKIGSRASQHPGDHRKYALLGRKNILINDNFTVRSQRQDGIVFEDDSHRTCRACANRIILKEFISNGDGNLFARADDKNTAFAGFCFTDRQFFSRGEAGQENRHNETKDEEFFHR